MRCHIIHCPLLQWVINPTHSVCKWTVSSGLWLETLTVISLFPYCVIKECKSQRHWDICQDYKALDNRTSSTCVLVYYTTSVFWVFSASISSSVLRQLGSALLRFLQLTSSRSQEHENSVKVALIRKLWHPFDSGPLDYAQVIPTMPCSWEGLIMTCGTSWEIPRWVLDSCPPPTSYPLLSATLIQLFKFPHYLIATALSQLGEASWEGDLGALILLTILLFLC